MAQPTSERHATSASNALYPDLWAGLSFAVAPPLGNTGSTLTDYSPSGLNGTLTNMDPATDWVTNPAYGLVLDFDGINDHVLYTAQNLGTTHSCSITINQRADVDIVWGGVSYAVGGYLLWFASASQVYYSASGNYIDWTPSPSGMTGWRNWIITRSGTSITLYRDGVSMGAKTLPGNTDLILQALGGVTGGGGKSSMQLGSAYAFNRVLTAAEIARLASDHLAPLRLRNGNKPSRSHLWGAF